MNYEEFVRNFAERTESNLNIIEAAVSLKNPNAFEVTQVINSTMGILIFPVEEYIKKLNVNNLLSENLFNDLISEIKILKGNRNLTADDLIKRLRNAFAHCNFEVKGGREIEYLIIWNQYDTNSPVNWKAKISIDTLRKIILLVAQELKTHVMSLAKPGAA